MEQKNDLYWLIQDKKENWFVDQLNSHTSPQKENAIKFESFEEAKNIANELGNKKFRVVAVRKLEGIEII